MVTAFAVASNCPQGYVLWGCCSTTFPQGPIKFYLVHIKF